MRRQRVGKPQGGVDPCHVIKNKHDSWCLFAKSSYVGDLPQRGPRAGRLRWLKRGSAMPRGANPAVISQQLRRLDWVVDLAFTCIPILEIISYSYYPRYRCLICLSLNYVISPSVIFEFICIHFISILTHQGCHRQQTTWSGCRIGLRHIKSSNRTNENCETKNFTRAQIQPPKRNSVILYGAHAGCY